ncbi:hypothetical protein BH09BAC6_BH09BAC6_22580 [soil metagenome]
MVKGYRKLENVFYLEIYDPYLGGDSYAGIFKNQLKGQDRYYLSNSINTATSIWQPYAIIVGRKGQTFSTGKLKVNGINRPMPRASGQ